MAGRLLCLHKALQTLTISAKHPISNIFLPVPQTFLPSLIPKRETSFFAKLPASYLWKSVTSVSNAGAKKGRGKASGRKLKRDLNRGQRIGSGNVNMLWPGLNSPIIRGRELVKQQELPEDPDRMTKLIKLRDSMGSFRRLKLSPFERGWSGAKMHGRKIGPPDPVGDYKFDGFESIILRFRPIVTMIRIGRIRRIQAIVVTGNGNGVAGFAFGKSTEGRTAIRRAKNRAAQKLMHFDLYNGHGIYHDFFSRFDNTRLFVYKKPEGYGLKCHRGIRAICQVLGIKDIQVKLEGSSNIMNVTRAFFIGLLQQKTHQQIAEEKKLHIVEFRKEDAYFPKVVASPKSRVRVAGEIPKDEILDFSLFSWRNRVVLRKKQYPKFYQRMPGWLTHLKKFEKRRNHPKIRKDLLVEYGEYKSFLNDKYPDQCEPLKTPLQN